MNKASPAHSEEILVTQNIDYYEHYEDRDIAHGKVCKNISGVSTSSLEELRSSYEP